MCVSCCFVCIIDGGVFINGVFGIGGRFFIIVICQSVDYCFFVFVQCVVLMVFILNCIVDQNIVCDGYLFLLYVVSVVVLNVFLVVMLYFVVSLLVVIVLYVMVVQLLFVLFVFVIVLMFYFVCVVVFVFVFVIFVQYWYMMVFNLDCLFVLCGMLIL